MPEPAFSMRATPARLRTLRARGVLDDRGLAEALSLACATPSLPAWQRFLDRWLAGVGLALILAGLLTFVAFNWDDLGRFARFGGAAVWIAAGVAVAWVRGVERLEGQLGLMASALGVGGLLALIGQAYQTGADDWTLFAGWAVLIVPWVIVGRFAPLWLLEIVLLNLALGFWVGQVYPEYGEWLGLGLAGLNGLAWVAWERGAAWLVFLRPRGIPRLVAAATVVPLTGLSMVLPFAGESGAAWVGTVLLVLVVAGLVGVTHVDATQDRFPTTAAVLGLVLVANAWLARFVFDLGGLDVLAFAVLVLAAGVLVPVMVFVTWLRTLPPAQSRWEVAS